MPEAPRLLPPLRAIANATAKEQRLPRAPRMKLTRRGGKIVLRAGNVEVTGHIAAPSSLASALVVAAAGRRVMDRATTWMTSADLWYPQTAAFLDLASACLARGREDDARDLAYLAIVETFYMEDVDEGSKPAPPPALLALVSKMKSPAESEGGAHLSVLRRLVPRLAKADRKWQLPLIRAITDVVSDAAYASPITLAELVSATTLAMERLPGARGEAGRALLATLAGSLMLSRAYSEALPLLDRLVARGYEIPALHIDRFLARAATADPRAEEDRIALDALAIAHPKKLRPHLAELEPWAALANAHVRAAQALELRARGLDACEQRPKKQIPKLAPGDDARFSALARTHVEHARRLLGNSLVADTKAKGFDAEQRRKHIHEDLHAVDARLHRAAGNHQAALAAFLRAHEAAQRDAYDYKKKAHVPDIKALAKKLGVRSPV